MSDCFDHEADAWDDALFGITSEEGYTIPSNRYFQICRYCGQKELAWGSVDGKWRLIDTNHKIHSCDKYSTAIAADREKNK